MDLPNDQVVSRGHLKVRVIGRHAGQHAWNAAVGAEMDEAERFVLGHLENGLVPYYVSPDVAEPPRRMVGFGPGGKSVLRHLADWGGYVVLQPEKPRLGPPEEVLLCSVTPPSSPATSPSGAAISPSYPATPTPSTGRRPTRGRHTPRPSWRASASA